MMAGAGGATRATGWRATAPRFNNCGEAIPRVLALAFQEKVLARGLGLYPLRWWPCSGGGVAPESGAKLLTREVVRR